jgi:hypothetical protein
MIRVGHRVVGKSTGNTLREGCLTGKCSSDFREHGAFSMRPADVTLVTWAR